jgi:hypothetical protein
MATGWLRAAWLRVAPWPEVRVGSVDDGVGTGRIGSVDDGGRDGSIESALDDPRKVWMLAPMDLRSYSCLVWRIGTSAPDKSAARAARERPIPTT